MIPFATSIGTVTRVEDATDRDPYDPPSDHPAPTTIASGVRAVISPPTGTARLVGGTRIVYDAKLTCDPTDLQQNDVWIDSGGLTWTVLSASQINAIGLRFTAAQLRLVEGAT